MDWKRSGIFGTLKTWISPYDLIWKLHKSQEQSMRGVVKLIQSPHTKLARASLVCGILKSRNARVWCVESIGSKLRILQWKSIKIVQKHCKNTKIFRLRRAVRDFGVCASLVCEKYLSKTRYCASLVCARVWCVVTVIESTRTQKNEFLSVFIFTDK